MGQYGQLAVSSSVGTTVGGAGVSVAEYVSEELAEAPDSIAASVAELSLAISPR